jgi:hypothetical protein
MRSMVPMMMAMMMGVGCRSELWVYAPEAELVVPTEGARFLQGEAVLTYDPTLFPKRIVSNGLRMSAVADSAVLSYPEARRGAAFLPHASDGSSLNLDGVYVDCGEPRCEVVVPFEVELPVEVDEVCLFADAILSAPQPYSGPQRHDAASLSLVVFH